ncbi:TniB family NTP-binding protein [Xanthomonas sp. BRIP62409]|uniref:TniB family NTP-binding protein n=1 Tax=Xanthomonas sp. BRIP62409 TaxID=2182388 RepID=UPI000F8D74A6|nr:TniB family NTP-binding protein [Xanthomonas sp. BRIP62409]
MPKNDPQNLLGLVASIRVEHAAYTLGYEALRDALRSVGSSANPICLHIVGDTRTGKSTLLEDFIQQHGRKVTCEGSRQAVVYVKVPDKGTVKGLLERLLRALGDPHWHRGSETNQTHRVLTLLESVGCRMIILDEFQHLSDKGQKKQLRSTADWLKTMVDSKQWALVAAGLPESASVIQSNRQLRERFDAPIILPTFDWRQVDQRVQFRAVLKAFQSQLSSVQLPDLVSAPMALRMYLATAGRIGIVAKLLDRAVRNAVKSGSHDISCAALGKAFAEVVWYANRFPHEGGPFCSRLDEHCSAHLLDQVIAIASEDSYADHSGEVQVVSNESDRSVPSQSEAKRKAKRSVRQVRAALRGAA